MDAASDGRRMRKYRLYTKERVCGAGVSRPAVYAMAERWPRRAVAVMRAARHMPPREGTLLAAKMLLLFGVTLATRARASAGR